MFLFSNNECATQSQLVKKTIRVKRGKQSLHNSFLIFLVDPFFLKTKWAIIQICLLTFNWFWD